MLKAFRRLPLKEFQIAIPRRVLALHAMVTSVGHCEERSTKYDWDGLRRGHARFTLFQWTVSGRGRLEFGGREYELVPGRTMVLQIPHAHRYYLPRDSTHWRFLYICIHGTEVFRLFRQYQLSFGPVWDLAPDSAPVRTLLKIYTKATAGQLNNPFVLSEAAYAMAMSAGAEGFCPKSRSTDRFAAVREYVEAHFATDLDIGALANVAGMSRFHFTRQFVKAERASPWEYLVQVRVRNAVRLLGDSKLSIKEVSAQCGFSNANYMGKVFRRVLGISPREFRRSGMFTSQSFEKEIP